MRISWSKTRLCGCAAFRDGQVASPDPPGLPVRMNDNHSPCTIVASFVKDDGSQPARQVVEHEWQFDHVACAEARLQRLAASRSGRRRLRLRDRRRSCRPAFETLLRSGSPKGPATAFFPLAFRFASASAGRGAVIPKPPSIPCPRHPNWSSRPISRLEQAKYWLRRGLRRSAGE